MNQEKLFKLFLRIIGVCGLSALPAVFMPYSWMNAIHSFLGMGEMPNDPITGYLARSESAIYVLLRVLYITLSFNIHRFRPVLCYLGGATVILAVMMVTIDIRERMPVYWIVSEGFGNTIIGCVTLVMALRLKPLEEPVKKVES